MTRTTRTPATLCPHCGYAMDAASSMQGEAVPDPGDWSICLRCAGVLQFDATLRPGLPALGAYEALRLADPEHWEAIEAERHKARTLQRIAPIPDRGGKA